LKERLLTAHGGIETGLATVPMAFLIFSSCASSYLLSSSSLNSSLGNVAKYFCSQYLV